MYSTFTNASLGIKGLGKWHIYSTRCTVDYHNDLWERADCLGLGQLYGMSIWGGGWGVSGSDNVRAEPGKLLQP